MKHDPATIGEAVDYLVWRDKVGMAAVVAELAADAEALRAENERLRAELAASREALRVTEGPSAAQQPRPE